MNDESLSPEERELLTAPIVERDTPDIVPIADSHDEFFHEVTNQQLRTIRGFHQRVANRFADGLSSLLQRVVEVRITEVQATTYSQFAFGRTHPTCLILLNATPLSESLCIDLNPSIFYPLLDGLLGGGRQPATIPDRPMTEIEKRLAIRIVEVLLDELHTAWEHVLAVQLEVDSVSANAQQVRMVPPGEHVITLSFRTRVTHQSGDITLCLPIKSIRKMIDKLSEGEQRSARSNDRQVADIVHLRAVLGNLSLAEADLQRLEPGEVIQTEIAADTSVQVFAEEQLRFRGRLGTIHGKKAVRIEQVIS